MASNYWPTVFLSRPSLRLPKYPICQAFGHVRNFFVARQRADVVIGHGNEPACARLQLQTGAESAGQQCADGGDEGLKPQWRPTELVAQHRGSRTCPNQLNDSDRHARRPRALWAPLKQSNIQLSITRCVFTRSGPEEDF